MLCEGERLLGAVDLMNNKSVVRSGAVERASYGEVAGDEHDHGAGRQGWLGVALDDRVLHGFERQRL